MDSVKVGDKGQRERMDNKPPNVRPAHSDQGGGGVQEINGCTLTTFDRQHKGGHLGSHDARFTPPNLTHQLPNIPLRYNPPQQTISLKMNP
ncbi:hypothetical protein PBY51_022015 [Eleginops maclovinus]|uniref:Uncharacterized protein n=1 Tax=Eleginops maclovinus TaxID=56733 RepID=A0AAN7XGT5_ELEMC|nr:hypothetical protein PBY51_022015 [Eleginops maclovinus]